MTETAITNLLPISNLWQAAPSGKGAVWLRPPGDPRGALVKLPDGSKHSVGQVFWDSDRITFKAADKIWDAGLPITFEVHGAEVYANSPGVVPFRLLNPDSTRIPEEVWLEYRRHKEEQLRRAHEEIERQDRANAEHSHRLLTAQLEAYGPGGVAVLREIYGALKGVSDLEETIKALGIVLPWSRRSTLGAHNCACALGKLAYNALSLSPPMVKASAEATVAPYPDPPTRENRDEWNEHQTERLGPHGRAARIFLDLFVRQGPWEDREAFVSHLQGKAAERERRAKVARLKAYKASVGRYRVSSAVPVPGFEAVNCLSLVSAKESAREAARRWPGVCFRVDKLHGHPADGPQAEELVYKIG